MNISLKITEDETKAFVKIIPKTPDDTAALTVDNLKRFLMKKGVVKGIKDDVLAEMCRNKEFDKVILVAEAVSPLTGDSGTIDIRVKPNERQSYDKGVGLEKQVDHYGEKEGFITFVEAGRILAAYVPADGEEKGFTVTGKELTGITGDNSVSLSDLQGENTKIENNNLIAEKSGVLRKEGDVFHIGQKVILEKDLGLATGSIILPLDADIHLSVGGDIKSGFTVQCRKITVMGNIEDATVTAKELIVNNGIIGKRNNPITANYLSVDFISGPRVVLSKFLLVKNAIAGGAKIQSDYICSDIIREGTIAVKYGMRVNFLLGFNTVQAGADYGEDTDKAQFESHLMQLTKALKDIKITNQQLLKKADSIRQMAGRMSNNPTIQKELHRLNQVNAKIKQLEMAKKIVEKKSEKNLDDMYLHGSPFILIESGFTKQELQKGTTKPLNDFRIYETPYDKSKPFQRGIYVLRENNVVHEPEYDSEEIRKLEENYKKAALN